jgi:hypothetical protein
MTTSDQTMLTQVHELLAAHGYEVTETGDGLLRIKDVETGITYAAALEGQVLFMSVNLTTVPTSKVSPELMRQMLSSDNGIATSSFQLVDSGDQTLITLNNFCTLQNMGEEDQDDVLSLTSYLMADLFAARNMLEPQIGKA